MSELAAFLLAQIAEDYADAMSGWRWKALPAGEYERLQARVLAECAAKRAIVEKVQRAEVAFEQMVNPASSAAVFALTEVLTLMAQPYAGADGWREEWAQ